MPADRPGQQFVTSTAVPPFIDREDMLDQLYGWSLIEAGENGIKNFGHAMQVTKVSMGSHTRTRTQAHAHTHTFTRDVGISPGLIVSFGLLQVPPSGGGSGALWSFEASFMEGQSKLTSISVGFDDQGGQHLCPPSLNPFPIPHL
jgi:hypothetical protein